MLSVQNLTQPRGLYSLSFVEMWERFGFYCVQSLLVLFLDKMYHFSDTNAYDLFNAFSALIFVTPIIGGFIADRLIGFRYSVVLGALLWTLGYFALATTSRSLFYLALALQICGNGFFKGCISSLLGTLYDGEFDPRRDSGFTIFYMGINIGAFISPIVCAWTAENFGWEIGFGVAAIGMSIGLLTLVPIFKKLGAHGLAPDPEHLTTPFLWGLSRRTLFFIGLLITIPLLTLFIQHARTIDDLFNLFCVFILTIVLIKTFRYERVQRNKMLLLIILMIFSVFFWSLYNQTFSSLVLFTERVIDRHLFGWEVPTAMYQSINPFFIIILSPLLALLWLRLANTRLNPSTPLKFALAILLLGAGFLMLPLGISHANSNGAVSQLWLTGSYFLQTLGELCLSPIGLAMVTALAPEDLTGMMMGVWFLSVAAGYAFGDFISNLASIPDNMTDLHAINTIYSHTFTRFGWIAVGLGLVLALLSPKLKKMM